MDYDYSSRGPRMALSLSSDAVMVSDKPGLPLGDLRALQERPSQSAVFGLWRPSVVKIEGACRGVASGSLAVNCACSQPVWFRFPSRWSLCSGRPCWPDRNVWWMIEAEAEEGDTRKSMRCVFVEVQGLRTSALYSIRAPRARASRDHPRRSELGRSPRFVAERACIWLGYSRLGGGDASVFLERGILRGASSAGSDSLSSVLVPLEVAMPDCFRPLRL